MESKQICTNDQLKSLNFKENFKKSLKTIFQKYINVGKIFFVISVIANVYKSSRDKHWMMKTIVITNKEIESFSKKTFLYFLIEHIVRGLFQSLFWPFYVSRSVTENIGLLEVVLDPLSDFRFYNGL